MNNKRKDDNLKEKVKQALIATEKAISEDFEIQKNLNQNSKKLNFFNLENLNSESDFIKARAESDSAALKKNFLIMKFLIKTYLQYLHAKPFIL